MISYPTSYRLGAVFTIRYSIPIFSYPTSCSSVAEKLTLEVPDLMILNKGRLKGLKPHSKLLATTLLRLPYSPKKKKRKASSTQTKEKAKEKNETKDKKDQKDQKDKKKTSEEENEQKNVDQDQPMSDDVVVDDVVVEDGSKSSETPRFL